MTNTTRCKVLGKILFDFSFLIFRRIFSFNAPAPPPPTGHTHTRTHTHTLLTSVLACNCGSRSAKSDSQVGPGLLTRSHALLLLSHIRRGRINLEEEKSSAPPREIPASN